MEGDFQKRRDMPEDELVASYQNLCDLSNSLTERLARREISCDELKSIQETLAYGSIKIKQQYRNRRNEKVYRDIIVIIGLTYKCACFAFDRISLESERANWEEIIQRGFER